MIRVLLLMLCVATPVWSVTPDEMLANPALEARAREVSRELRCLVCRNESIDESNAVFAKELRILVRERITAGDSKEQAIAYIVDRYGEYVLLNPRATGSTLILWLAGPVFLLLALGVGGLYVRRRKSAAPAEALSSDEQSRLSQILDK